jgi:two-component system chemotaxis sensor kinase CheA
MRTSEQEFLEEMRKTFTIEAEEHLQTIASGLMEIEKQKSPAKCQDVTETIYRAAHSLKGAARSVNLPGVEAVCQSTESVLSAMKRRMVTPVESDFDVLQRAVDIIERMVASGTGEQDAELSQLIAELERIAAREKAAPAATPPAADHKCRMPATAQEVAEPRIDGCAAVSGTSQIAGAPDQAPPARPAARQAMAVAPGKPGGVDSIRIATAKLDSILLQAEELISIKLAAEQRIAELGETLAVLRPWIKEWEKAGSGAQVSNRRQEMRKTGNATTQFDSERSAPSDSFEWSFACMREVDARLSGLMASLQTDRRATGALVDQLLDGAKNMLMLPISTILQTLPKMVRDICREQSKEVDLVFTGGEIEVDKRILERMKDPLMHLLRNAIDHGPEKPGVRRALNQSPCGTITVDISQADGNRIQILVSDDGAGIDAEKLRDIAVKRGFLSREEANSLEDQAALMLIFQSGVSTSSLITDISGRGLGLAIVQEAVDKLGGQISLETCLGKGTTFRISLPLTLATFHGMLLQEYGQRFAVPITNVERALRVRREDVRTMENRETILVDGMPLSLVRLGTVLGLAPAAEEAKDRPMIYVIVLTSGPRRVAFSVDSLLHEQELLIKGLGKQLVRVRNIAGATVLGSGRVVPVLNVADLIESAVQVGRTASTPQAAEAETQQKSVLVVEDSITSRMLLKNILASAGFDVHTVVDGVEAWTALKERRFNAVVSDVEMPRMNGFDLTTKIRADEKLTELPVVLVTSLKSQSDREHGIEVGADAYIVKSSFDQSNLLEVVQRLIGRNEA